MTIHPPHPGDGNRIWCDPPASVCDTAPTHPAGWDAIQPATTSTGPTICPDAMDAAVNAYPEASRSPSAHIHGIRSAITAALPHLRQQWEWERRADAVEIREEWAVRCTWPNGQATEWAFITRSAAVARVRDNAELGGTSTMRHCLVLAGPWTTINPTGGRL